MSCSVFSTMVLIALVAVHRVLFRRHGQRELVLAAHRMAPVGNATLAGSLTAATVLVLWVLLPLRDEHADPMVVAPPGRTHPRRSPGRRLVVGLRGRGIFTQRTGSSRRTWHGLVLPFEPGRSNLHRAR
ncbi:DUF6328 family protein [Nakamurella sp. UYEF19]|uniref:DUF6328 family protein n=1 Tax=Nakamurella sp. UYEF19 TaxID=1756392 RepID=UPI003396F9C7